LDEGIDSDGVARRKKYERRIPKYLKDIRKRWKPLVIHRNAYLAHMDLTKTPPLMTYRFLWVCCKQAQAVDGGYHAAYRDTARFFEVPG